MLTRRRGRGERGDKILRWRHSNCTHYDACRRETAWVFPETFRSASRKTEQPFQAQSVSHRTDLTSLESKCTPRDFPRRLFLYPPFSGRTNGAQWRQGESKFLPCFFVAWTQRRLTECFPWATEGPNTPKETLNFKKESFWQTTSGSLPAGVNYHPQVLTPLTPEQNVSLGESWRDILNQSSFQRLRKTLQSCYKDYN